MNTSQLLDILAKLIFLAPLSGVLVLSLVGMTPLKGNERCIKKIVAVLQSISFASAFIIATNITYRYLSGEPIAPLHVIHRHLFSFGHHSTDFGLQIDAITIWFILMATILSNIVGVFSQHYLHRDPGFFRFFFLITLFLTGVLVIFMGATFQVVFIGWELVGITSALLISFFTLRRETIDNALHAFWTYRISDVGLLCGSLILAAQLPEATFGQGTHTLPGSLAYFSSWLPRAMEGPTSSSAIFYGGLSIHAGVYLLLRLRLEFHIPLAILIALFLVGLISCIYGVLLSQIQSDVKSALAYASLSQVGIMFVEISLGWYWIAAIHCLGHAFMRTYQILKCSSIIHQFVEFEDIHQDDAESARAHFLHVVFPDRLLNRIFSVAFDLSLRAASGPSRSVLYIEKASLFFQRLEERWTAFLTRPSHLAQKDL